MKRRDIIKNIGFAGLTLVGAKTFAQTIQNEGEQPICGQPKIRTGISKNHQHEIQVSYEAVISGQELSLDIMGGSRHTHTVLLTAEILQILREKSEVEIESTTDLGHSHLITLKRDLIPE